MDYKLLGSSIIFGIVFVLSTLAIPTKVENYDDLRSAKYGYPLNFIVQEFTLDPPTSWFPQKLRMTIPKNAPTDFKLPEFTGNVLFFSTLIWIVGKSWRRRKRKL